MHKRRDWLTKKYDDNFSITNLLELVFILVVTEIYDSDKPEGTVCKNRHSQLHWHKTNSTDSDKKRKVIPGKN